MRRLFLLTIFPLLWNASAEAVTMCPDGSYVGGSSCRQAPDGSFVSGDHGRQAPDGTFTCANVELRF